MNWRRGFFRLWLAVAAIWVVGVVIAAYSRGTFDSPAPVRFNYLGWEFEFAGDLPKEKVKEALVHFLREEIAPVEKSKPLAAEKIADTIVGQYEPHSFVASVGRLAKVVVIPPLALLLVGGTFGWALAGFRSMSRGVSDRSA
jgi:hypothetical protein